MNFILLEVFINLGLMKSELPYLLALTYVPGIGPINQRKILNTVELKSLWTMSNNELKDIFRKRPEFIPYFQSSETLDLAYSEIEFCKENDIKILSYNSENYPKNLKNCVDAPLVFFSKGNYDFDKKIHLGIVGTRLMTRYGKEFIWKLIEDLSDYNFGYISGLAFGCDVEMHRACIEYNLSNVAVLAHGLNRISPSRHQKEAKKIVENGALITEYSTFHKAEAMNFILRNRIIAGLCDALIVVESDIKGGSMSTANYANAYNREVFALPGRINDKFSLGCNHLIQNNQAYLIRDAKDLLNYFSLIIRPKPKQIKLFIDLDKDEQPVYDYLKKNGRQQVDKIGIDLNIPVFKLNSILLNLELKGVVRPLSGKFFEIQ